MKDVKQKEGFIKNEALAEHKKKQAQVLKETKARLKQVRGKHKFTSKIRGKELTITINGVNAIEKFNDFCLRKNYDSSKFTVQKIN